MKQNLSLLENLRLQVDQNDDLSLHEFMKMYPSEDIYEVMSAVRWLERNKYIKVIDLSNFQKIDCILIKSWRKGPVRPDGKLTTYEVFQEYWEEIKQKFKI